GLPAARPGPQWKPIGAERLLLDLPRQSEIGMMNQLQIVQKALRLLDPAIAAEPIDIAADRGETMERAESLHAGAEGIDAVAADERRRPFRIDARRRDDLVLGHAGQRRRALWRKF